MPTGSDLPRLSRGARAVPRVGIVHLGPGAFFRSFVAPFVEDAMEARGGDWGICAVGLNSARARDLLAPQGCVYTAVPLGPDGPRPRVIGAIAEVLAAPGNPQAVLDRMADPAVRIVSLTITEKGYHHHPSSGRLALEDAAIRADLARPHAPATAPGLLVEALDLRRRAGLRPFTVLSCDNLPGNGGLVRGLVEELAQARDAGLARWIAREGRFPATVVDRITPATTRADIAGLARRTGFHDAACVFHEPFRQWVIEDDFVDGARPAWEACGAELVADVAPFEMMKLRCLNGTHSALAYLGYLAGHATIAEAVADPVFAGYVEALWTREIMPTVAAPEGVDLPAYGAALMERYRNPAIRHRTWQIAMDGSRKLPQRLLSPMADNLAAGRPVDGLALAVAGWMRFVGGTDEVGRPIDVRDPLAARLRAAWDGASDPAGRAAAFLAIDEVFDPALARDARFVAAVTGAIERLCRDGARAVVARYVA